MEQNILLLIARNHVSDSLGTEYLKYTAYRWRGPSAVTDADFGADPKAGLYRTLFYAAAQPLALLFRSS